MKIKTKITEDNYQEVVLKRSIIICWVLLAICFVVKLFGGNFFEIMCTNEKFIGVCRFLETSGLCYVEGYITFIFSSTCLLLIIRDNKKVFNKNTLFYIILCSIYWGLKIMIETGVINIPMAICDIMDFVVLYLLLFIFSRKWHKSILAVVLMFVFTMISAITKNIGFSGDITNSMVIANIFMLDYYIMLVLTLLYSIKIKRRKE